LPGILTQLGSEGLSHLKRLANNVVGSKILSSVQEGKEEDDIPELVENFENVANSDSPAAQEKKAEEIAAMIASSTLEEAVKAAKPAPAKPTPAPAAAAKPAPAAAKPAPAAAKPAEEKKDAKKETTPKKSNEKGGKKQQSKDKKA
jgi:hypothetical protein